MVRRQESVTGWFPDRSSDCIRFGHFFFLFSIQGYGKDKPVCQLHCRKHSTFPFILCSVYSEPMAEVEFLSYYSFRIPFVVRGIPDSFTNLQNLIRAKARPATAVTPPATAEREHLFLNPRVSVSRNCGGKLHIQNPKSNSPTPFASSATLPRTCPDPVGALVGALHA